MRVEIHCSPIRAGEVLKPRVVLFNDSYEPVTVSRNAFVGPNIPAPPGSFPRPESVEPTFGMEEEPLTLQPFSFYGREREFADLPAGEVDVSAYYDGDGGRIETTHSVVVGG